MRILTTLKKQNILILVLLVGILILAAYLRLYRISDYMTFLGDEGRDVLVAKSMLEGNLTLLGPRSSAGDFFMGPAYYYMITPWLWLFNYDPVGPAVMVALFGIATVWLIYYVGKQWFSEKAGLMAAAFYTVSPIVINYSHSSWNPDVLPFFALLMLYVLFKAVQVKKQTRYFVGVGLLLGISLQLHYLALFLGVIVFAYTFFARWYINKKIKIIETLRYYFHIFVGFLLGLSPFLLFEIRHGFPNIQTIFKFIFGDSAQKGYVTGGTYLSTVNDVFFRIFGKLVFYYPSPDRYQQFSPEQLTFLSWFAMIAAIAAIIVLFKKTKNKLVLMLVAFWLFFGIFLFGFYKKNIYDYHFVYLFPLPFLIIGNFFAELSSFGKTKVQKVIAVGVTVVLFGGIIIHNWSGRPFVYESNRQKDQARIISEAVIKYTDNKPYNFALISGGNSDHAYRYYLDVLGHPPIQIETPLLDPERKTVTDQLIVVCEDTACKPYGHPLFDVAAFGRAEIVAQSDVIVVKVYKLIHYTEKK
jgi:4-amino-4-deoxy-L-arabinose transferase-like glycosyltransferase